MAVKRLVQDFSGWTSAHGVPHIASANKACIKLFWTAVLIVCIGLLVFQVSLLVSQYLDYNVSVQTTLKFEEREFPALSICNLNPYKKSTLQQISPEMNDLVNNYNTTFGQKSLADERKKSDTVNLLTHLAAQLSAEQLDTITYSAQELLGDCAFNAQPCNMTQSVNQTQLHI